MVLEWTPRIPRKAAAGGSKRKARRGGDQCQWTRGLLLEALEQLRPRHEVRARRGDGDLGLAQRGEGGCCHVTISSTLRPSDSGQTDQAHDARFEAASSLCPFGGAFKRPSDTIAAFYTSVRRHTRWWRHSVVHRAFG